MNGCVAHGDVDDVDDRRPAAPGMTMETTMVRQTPTQADRWHREICKIDRRIMAERTTPEQKQDLWRRRNELLEAGPDAFVEMSQ